MYQKLQQYLFQPTPIASTVVARFAFGLIIFWEAIRYFKYGKIAKLFPGDFHFKYHFFEWVEPLSPIGMYAVFAALAVCGLCMAIGLFYRFFATSSFILFSYIYLIEQAEYLNHFYLIIILNLLFVFLPAHRAYSVDSYFDKTIHSNFIPFWSIWILRFQLAIVYFYAGVAKINYDWLFRAQPMREWVGYIFENMGFSSTTVMGICYFLSWSGIIFDLLIAPALYWRRTRAVAFLFAIVFHALNNAMFSIGVFPALALSMTTIFFEPDWPLKLFKKSRIVANDAIPDLAKSSRHIGTALLAIFVFYQIAMPIRHLLYPGAISWTEEGHRFSWHMKLRDKDGEVRFLVVDVATNEKRMVDPRSYLTNRQYDKMAGRPDMILQFAHYLRDLYQPHAKGELEVYAYSIASLNSRPKQRLVDHTVNLAKVKKTIWPADWIVPLDGDKQELANQVAQAIKEPVMGFVETF